VTRARLSDVRPDRSPRGIRLVAPEDDEWLVAPLHAMEAAHAQGAAELTPPSALWVRGVLRLDETVAQAVAIVGARDATPYGVRVAADLAYGLAGWSWTIVSGGAYGIDGAAHRGALAAGGTTVAVLPGGLSSPYPAGHAILFDQVASAGLLVSEWPPDCAPQRHHFALRNRLIAAFAAGVVVVEAGLRSGAFSTVRRSRELGRPVMAVPGPISSARSAGCHRLLRGGAQLVTSAGDVLETIEVGEGRATLESRANHVASLTPGDCPAASDGPSAGGVPGGSSGTSGGQGRFAIG
jgi:DNA processing protein